MKSPVRVPPVRLVLGAALLVVLAGTAWLGVQAVAPSRPTAGLVSFLGSLQVSRGGGAFAGARTGDRVVNGDEVRTGPLSRAAIDYPSGSVTRLDALATVKVASLARVGPSWSENLIQLAGKSWTKVVKLTGGARFTVSAPNGTSLEVRGTQLSVYVEPNAVRVDAWSGTVSVAARGTGVQLQAGKSTSVLAGQPPTSPQDIPLADRADPFTLFNLAADIAGGTVVLVSEGVLAGGSFGPAPAATGDGSSGLVVGLAWPTGATFQLSVIRPDGAVFKEIESQSGLITIVVPHAKKGVWRYYVVHVEPTPAVPWSVVVSRPTP